MRNAQGFQELRAKLGHNKDHVATPAQRQLLERLQRRKPETVEDMVRAKEAMMADQPMPPADDMVPSVRAHLKAAAQMDDGQRPPVVSLHTMVYFYDTTKSHRKPMDWVVRRVRQGNLPATLQDDDGQPINGRIVPDTCAVDGCRILALVEAQLQPHHRVTRTFGIRDHRFTLVQLARRARARLVNARNAAIAMHRKEPKEGEAEPAALATYDALPAMVRLGILATVRAHCAIGADERLIQMSEAADEDAAPYLAAVHAMLGNAGYRDAPEIPIVGCADEVEAATAIAALDGAIALHDQEDERIAAEAPQVEVRETPAEEVAAEGWREADAAAVVQKADGPTRNRPYDKSTIAQE